MNLEKLHDIQKKNGEINNKNALDVGVFSILSAYQLF
jgi:hypothetical protein